MFRNTALCAWVALLPICAGAQQKFAQRSTTINAGILLFDSYNQSGGILSDDIPHALFNLDSNARVKPAGWTFDNPAHPSVLTDAIVSRWSALDPSGDVPSSGTRSTKRDAAYWEVPLDSLTDQLLSEYNLLVMPAHGTVQLNPLEREALRKFVDKGGVLWVDLGNTTTIDLVNNLPLPIEQSAPATVLYTDYLHPVLNYPNSISIQDLNQMQSIASGGIKSSILAADIGSAAGIQGSVLRESTELAAVAGDGANATLMVGHIGDGYEVVTSGGVLSTLNHLPGTTSNSFFVGGTPSYDRSSDSAARIAFNMVGLTSDDPTSGKGARKANSSPIDLGAPLLQEWADTSVDQSPTSPKQNIQPAIFKSLVIVSRKDPSSSPAAYQLVAYDINNANGSINGLNYTPVWSSVDIVPSGGTAGPISAPTCFEVPNPTAPATRNQVCVSDSAGTVWAFNIYPTSKTNVAPIYKLTLPSPQQGAANFDLTEDGAGPYPPTFHEGLLFMADMLDPGANSVGRVWIGDPSTGTVLMGNSNPWVAGGSGQAVLSEVTGPPTVGYIPIQDNSGGLDEVVYVPTRGGSTGTNSTAGVTSLWFGVKGEKPTSATISGGTTLQVTTRASSQVGLDVYVPGSGDSAGATLLSPKLTILDQFGNPLSTADMNATMKGTYTASLGIISFDIQDPSKIYLDPNGNPNVRVDYTIANWDAGSATDVNILQRGQINLPDDPSTHLRRILDHVTMGPDGTLYMVTSSQNPSDPDQMGGCYFAIQESGRGNFIVKTRWDLYDNYTVALNQSTSAQQPPTVINNDAIGKLYNSLSDPTGIHKLTFMSAPVVSNGVVYAIAEGTQSLGLLSIPDTVLLAFNATPPVIEINTGDLGADFTILQPDITRSTASKSDPDVYSVLQSNQYVYEQQPGSATGTLRIDNLSSTTRGPILNCLSTSQPVVVRKAGAPDVLLEPNATGSRWNPLLWYSVFTGSGVQPGDTRMGFIGAPIVTGNTIFVPCTSALPSLLQGVRPPSNVGIIYGINTAIAPNDPYLVADTGTNRPWLQQLSEVNPAKAALGQLSADGTDFLWPQISGATSGADLSLRINQATVPTSLALGVAAGYGKLIAWSDGGVFAYSKANFIVADEGRLAVFDSVGNPVWSTEQTLSTGPGNGGSVGNVKLLTHPTRAYALGTDQYVVVDPGSNRLAIFDQSGRELRSIESFTVDPSNVPDGYTANEPTTFANPSDVTAFSDIVPQSSNKFSNAQPYEYWVHYVLADAGNRRLLELVDRYPYNNTTNQIGVAIALGELNWHSNQAVSGKRFSYTSIARTFYNGAVVYAAGIGNAQPTYAGTGLQPDSTSAQEVSSVGNGGIVIVNGANTTIINQVSMPSVAANLLYAEGASDLSGGFTQPGYPGGTKLLGNLNSVTMRTVTVGGTPELRIMFTDTSGVYEIHPSGGGWAVDWMLPRTLTLGQGNNAPVYSIMRRDSSDLPTTGDPLDFRPTYAKRLASGDILITNGYVGRFRKAPTSPAQDFTGEVIVIDQNSYNPASENLGFNSSSVRFNLPPVTSGRSITLPVFADRK